MVVMREASINWLLQTATRRPVHALAASPPLRNLEINIISTHRHSFPPPAALSPALALVQSSAWRRDKKM